ncbi:glycosyltransferase family 4 protein [Asanoa sp. WMMD1127]|uniref:glycosyltransferase family 4 protein n=1 Tax=Asanoa sp. WMMD1127 TaxID=3016107 RepID=UPI00241797E5|nr:glycosyltransferase family 4 protein [Asanoa sp. WMMD1127]MDG4824548.1 glycosyltransferase family 4 protein [Asanoa sp. WMMD1127]
MTDAERGQRWTGAICLVLASSTGGVGQHVVSLVRGLTAAGATVTVAGPAATEAQFHFTAAGAARFVPVEIPANPTLNDRRAIGALRAALNADGVDLVHAHGLRAGLVAVLAKPHQPVVVTWHNAVLARRLRGYASRFVERMVARNADVCLGASEDLVERARALGARDARLAPVAAPELPEPRRGRAAVRAEFGLVKNQAMVLSVGRLHPQKRYDVLVEAAATWRDIRPAPAVLVAGSGPAYLPLAALISQTHAPVTLLGHRGDVADLLEAADVALVTSDWEARQLFAQEALRAGVPLVATAVGGLPDLVGDAAVLVPPGNVAAVSDAVRDLLGDEAKRAEYRARGFQRAKTWPSEEAMLSQLEGIYGELVPT